MSMPGQRSVSLVLGSGGARGLAHIGVIEILEERGYRIESIAGCSIGALIGGIYAMGKLPVYKDWVCALERVDVLRLLDFSLGKAGLIKGDRLIEALRESIGDTLIEDLPCRFTAVATDLDARREVWLDRGQLFDAIRASIAVPTLFAPARRNGRSLVDGGLLNPVPIAPTLRDQTDLTIAVDTSGRRDPNLPKSPDRPPSGDGRRDSYREAVHRFVETMTARLANSLDWSKDSDQLGFFDVINRSFDVMQGAISRHKLAAHQPDLLIEIPRNVCQTYEYYRGEEIIAIGRRQASRAMDLFET